MDEKQVKSKVCGINIDKEIKEETIIFLYKTFGMGAVQELPNSYWVENGLIKSKYIVKYLIEKILKYKSRKQVIQNLSIKTFREAKLTNMMRILYNNNLFKAIDNDYERALCYQPRTPTRQWRKRDRRKTGSRVWYRLLR